MKYPDHGRANNLAVFNPYPNFQTLQTTSHMAKNTNKPAVKAAAVQTTVKVNSKVAEKIEIIKATQPHVKTAYFNADGEYHFHKRPGFKAVPIQEEEEIDLETEAGDEEPDDEPVDTGKKLDF